jgi:hypothetical protein
MTDIAIPLAARLGRCRVVCLCVALAGVVAGLVIGLVAQAPGRTTLRKASADIAW